MVVRESTVSRCSAPLTLSVTSASIGGGTLPRQCCGYGLGYEAWLVDHLPPGEAEGSEPHHRVDGVASAVFLESLRRQVGGSAVGLDDELLRAPEEVDFLFAHHCVHLGPRQLRIEDEGEEPLLEHGAGDVWLVGLQRPQRRPQLSRRPTLARANCSSREHVSRRRRCSARWTRRSVWCGLRVVLRSTRVRATV